MARYRGIFNFEAILAVAVACLAAPSTASDICLWCDPALSRDFLSCTHKKIRESPFFYTLPETSLDDMEKSILAARNAITESSDSRKMSMMNGAMAGELREIIKSQPTNQDPKTVTDNLMGILETCFTQVSGQVDKTFLAELRRIVDVMQTDKAAPPDEKSAEPSNILPPQNQVQYPNYQPLYFPQQQTAASSSANVNQGNNQPYWSGPLNNNQPRANKNYSVQPITGQSSASYAKSMAYTNNAFFGGAPTREIPIKYSLNQQNNKPFFTPNTFLQQNRNTGSTNNNQYNRFSNAPRSDFPQNYGPWNNAIPNYINGQNMPPNALPEQNTQQTISTAFSEAKTFQPNGQNLAVYPQSWNKNPNTGGRALDQLGPYQQNYQPYNPPNQFGQSNAGATATAIAATSYNGPQPNYSYDSSYPTSSDLAPPSSPWLGNNNGNNAVVAPTGLSPVFNNNPPNISENKTNSGTNQPNLPGGNDDGIARALKFAETIYIILSQSSTFTGVFNEDLSNDQAISITYDTIFNALKKCGYLEFADEIANAGIVSVALIPAQSQSSKWAEAFSKFLMTQFNTKGLIGKNPNNQALTLASAILEFLRQFNGPSNGDSLTDTENPTALGSSDSNAPDPDKKLLHDGIKFFEALYYNLCTSDAFKYIFNIQTSNFDAKLVAIRMLVNLATDYGKELALETARECERRISLLPTNCPTEIYAKIIAKCVTDVFLYYSCVSPYTPAAQAKDVAAKMINYLEKIIKNAANQQPTTVNSQNDKSKQQPDSSAGSDPQDDYYYYLEDNTPQKDQQNQQKDNNVASETNKVPEQQNQQNDNDDDDYDLTAQGDQKDQENDSDVASQTDQTPTQQDDDNVPAQTDQTPKQTSQQDDDYYDDEYYDDDYLTTQTDTQKGNTEKPKLKDEPPKSKSNTNSKAAIAKLLQKIRDSSVNSNKQTALADNTTPPVVQPNAPNNQNPNFNKDGNSGQTTEKNPLQIIPDETSAESKSRINILMKYAKLCMSNGKFDYKIFSSVIAALVKFVQKTHSEWGFQKAQTTVLIEAIIGLTQLLLKAQDCTEDLNDNLGIAEIPVSGGSITSPDQTNGAVQANANSYSYSTVQGNSAPLYQYPRVPLYQYPAHPQAGQVNANANSYSTAHGNYAPQQIAPF